MDRSSRVTWSTSLSCCTHTTRRGSAHASRHDRSSSRRDNGSTARNAASAVRTSRPSALGGCPGTTTSTRYSEADLRVADGSSADIPSCRDRMNRGRSSPRPNAATSPLMPSPG
ncbi:hypothetical protein [Saccharothrix saharensis]|uniref:hypothetical protein n=1 Tax=Saccharothrix saharensis TaxID=571190 RepID=UPI00147975EE